MPLLDHFHPPLSLRRQWGGLHSLWAGAITARLNGGLLPPDHFAEPQISVGRVEVDVATKHGERNGAAPPLRGGGEGGIATLTAPVWAPAAPALHLDAAFPDDIEVLVYGTEAGPTLVGAIELVSPRNKDRPAARRAFAMKCLTYLQSGVGVVVVDVVTSRLANLHDEMAELLLGDAPRFPGSPPIYAAAYRPLLEGERERIAAWPETLAVGAVLPVLPLWLRDVEAPVPVDLESTYGEALHRLALA